MDYIQCSIGNILWRTSGRPPGAQSGHLVFDLGHSPLHSAFALCQFVLDRHPQLDHWIDSGFGVFDHSCFCAGTRARENWHGLGVLLRVRVWTWRNRRGPVREAGRRDEHWFCLPRLLVSARCGYSDGISAEPATDAGVEV